MVGARGGGRGGPFSLCFEFLLDVPEDGVKVGEVSEEKSTGSENLEGSKVEVETAVEVDWTIVRPKLVLLSASSQVQLCLKKICLKIIYLFLVSRCNFKQVIVNNHQ